MAKIIDPDDIKRFAGYCPECGSKVYLLFVSNSECVNCGWKGSASDLLDVKELRKKKLDEINEQ